MVKNPLGFFDDLFLFADVYTQVVLSDCPLLTRCGFKSECFQQALT
jgi:hypothetical protein